MKTFVTILVVIITGFTAIYVSIVLIGKITADEYTPGEIRDLEVEAESYCMFRVGGTPPAMFYSDEMINCVKAQLPEDLRDGYPHTKRED